MIASVVRFIGLASCALAFTAVAFAQPAALPGTKGSAVGDGWQASWLNLKPFVSFKRGDTLRITVGGSAENIVVRLLPADSDPSSPDGIEGDARKVPADKIVIVKLAGDRPTVKQISVHGGREAHGIPLGGNNGPVQLLSVTVERVKAD
jgi:hypothetical protein